MFTKKDLRDTLYEDIKMFKYNHNTFDENLFLRFLKNKYNNWNSPLTVETIINPNTNEVTMISLYYFDKVEQETIEFSTKIENIYGMFIKNERIRKIKALRKNQ